jgi:hypothetical protein
MELKRLLRWSVPDADYLENVVDILESLPPSDWVEFSMLEFSISLLGLLILAYFL